MAVFAGFSQVVTIAYGPAYTSTKEVVSLVNGNNGGISGAQTANVFSVSYEHFLSDSRFSLFTVYSKFDGYTFMFYEKGGASIPGGDIVAGSGYNGTVIYRYNLGLAYNLIQKKRRFYFSPNISFGIQNSKPNGKDIYPFEIIGPNYIETEPTSAVAFKTIQIVPSGGFRTGWVFWKRLDIGLSFQGVLGFKPYQKMYFKYEYKGTPQPTAEFEANGTGLFVTLGIGYRFAKLIQ